MKTRKTFSQQTLDRLATLYEYADGNSTADDVEETIEIGDAPCPVMANGNQKRTAESERLLRRMLQAHEGVTAGDG